MRPSFLVYWRRGKLFCARVVEPFVGSYDVGCFIVHNEEIFVIYGVVSLFLQKL